LTPDLVLAGGRVLDPSRGIDTIADVVVSGDRIVAVGPRARDAYPRAVVRDCTGLLVTPGLIDQHVHVLPGLGDFCVEPDRAGVAIGVPAVVDGGTSGVATFGLARRFLESSEVHTRVLAWMDPCQLYLAT